MSHINYFYPSWDNYRYHYYWQKQQQLQLINMAEQMKAASNFKQAQYSAFYRDLSRFLSFLEHLREPQASKNLKKPQNNVCETPMYMKFQPDSFFSYDLYDSPFIGHSRKTENN
ncbi:hypothetical protein LIER_23117 [Lithospermum erythrorhizon]|uniref:Uncharacterized protein n=1 Tax=Lithospermum erythrorhizon TaxID=34254 RepID=A0AAV3QXT4_LITER